MIVHSLSRRDFARERAPEGDTSLDGRDASLDASGRQAGNICICEWKRNSVNRQAKVSVAPISLTGTLQATSGGDIWCTLAWSHFYAQFLVLFFFSGRLSGVLHICIRTRGYEISVGATRGILPIDFFCEFNLK